MTKDFTSIFDKKIVLFAPLNWGLGHATRCLPLINTAIKSASKVIIASDGAALELLQQYFKDLDTYPLPPYNVKYKYESMLLNGITQAPKVWLAVQNEQKAIKSIVEKENVEVILSDNRFGCFDLRCYNIFITHQLTIQYHIPVIKAILNYQNKKWAKRFDEIWVPDYSDSRLSGDLSKTSGGFPSCNYIGPQSIHQPRITDKKWDILVLLSGPEPQRTILQNILLRLMNHLKTYKVLFVGGAIQTVQPKMLSDYHIYAPILIGAELTTALNESKLVICRSGYSTIMDLDSLGVGSIFIPTPGQTEQEYLAKMLSSISEDYDFIKQVEIEQKLIPLINKRLQ